MELLNINEHLCCFNYDHSERPRIEILEYTKGEQDKLQVNTNEVVFFYKGKVKYIFQNYPECVAEGGKMLFLPMGYKCAYHAQSDAIIVIFRLYNPIKLCEGFFVERLYNSKDSGSFNRRPKTLKMLDINPHMMHYISGLTNCVKDGIKCKHYFDIKISEFFLMLRSYYPKNELREFLGLILSRDTAFSEYVKNNRNKYPTVIALAESMHLTQKQFAKRFRKVFGRPPYGWMKEGRAMTIQHEITATKKPIKQIAIESGFGSVVQFAKFCKKELGKTPMDLRSGSFKD